ncbi:unnamed protein product [Strongylus vulgaris]|uniref:Uncharacterized protein n=1 Tax=Strongylus vulgaris TaxID=40348 RepID=A0A3P7L7R7_STRVU|nr:unnamed protein product [Strongylus vulgaris]
MSSMSPTVIFDNKTKQTIVRHLLFGETIKQAIDAPMLHNQYIPIINMIDEFFPKLKILQLWQAFLQDLQNILEQKHGQNFTGNTVFKGVTHGVTVDRREVRACGDFRRTTPQAPAGY